MRRKLGWILIVLGIIATLAAWWWCCSSQLGASLLGGLDPEQTLAAAEFRHLDRAAKRALQVMDILPEGARPKEVSLSAIGARLGGDPALPATWADWGLDPERGVALSADRRLLRKRGSSVAPVPVLLARVTDRGRLQALLGKAGIAIKLGQQIGAIQELEVEQQKAWLGQRGEDLAVLPLPGSLSDAEQTSLRAGFEAFLRPSGPKLSDDPQFSNLSREAGDRWLLAWVDARHADQLETRAGPRADIAFLASLFPNGGLWLGDDTGIRLVTSPAGQQALSEVVKPKRNPPKCSRLLPKLGWAGARMSVNLIDMMAGIGKFLPPSTPAEARAGLVAAPMALAMVGLSWTELAETLSGHACGGIEIASAIGALATGLKAQPAWLVAVGVVDGPKADALLDRLAGLMQGKGGAQAKEILVRGHKGWQLALGPVQVVVARVDDALLLGPSAAALEVAAERKTEDSLGSTSLAEALDGDVVLGFGADIQPLIDAGRAALALGGKDSSAVVDAFVKDLQGQHYAGSTLALDAHGLILRSGGDPLLQSAALGMAPLLATIAVPNLLRYRRGAQPVQARTELQQLAHGAQRYFASPHPETGAACQFPASAPIQPTRGCCDPESDKDGDHRCDPESWMGGPTWTALGYSPAGPSRYQFSFESSGTLSQARFAARAYVDLDCTGAVSTFEITGHGQVDSDGACAAVLDGEVQQVSP